MSSGRWLIATFGFIALLIGINIAVAYSMDLFGIFRDPHGRALITSDHERKAKYLLNQAYVPANFDALIIGASASVNWRSTALTGFRFYNESLEGGDASEERRLVEQALPKGKFKVAIVALYPRITALHVLQDGFDKVSRAEVLGSVSSLGMEYDTIANGIRHRPPVFFPDGGHELPIHAPPDPNDLGPKLDGTQDPEAVADYRALVQELLDRGVLIVYVTNPVFGPRYEYNRDVMTRYMQSVAETMPPAPVIDFNAPEYAWFRNDPRNFIDDVHLSAAGADTLSRILNTRLQEILQAN